MPRSDGVWRHYACQPLKFDAIYVWQRNSQLPLIIPTIPTRRFATACFHSVSLAVFACLSWSSGCTVSPIHWGITENRQLLQPLLSTDLLLTSNFTLEFYNHQTLLFVLTYMQCVDRHVDYFAAVTHLRTWRTYLLPAPFGIRKILGIFIIP